MTGPIRTHDFSHSNPDGEQPPRPPNAWILYRADKMREIPKSRPGEPRLAQADMSRIISRMWKEECDETRAEYERRADAKKAEHAIRYPGYRFQPMSKEEKKEKREQKKQKKREERRVSRGQTPVRVPPPVNTNALPIQALPVHLATVFHVAHPFGFPPPTPASTTSSTKVPVKSEPVTPSISVASSPNSNTPTQFISPYATQPWYDRSMGMPIYPTFWYPTQTVPLHGGSTLYLPAPVSQSVTQPTSVQPQSQPQAVDFTLWSSQKSTPAPPTPATTSNEPRPTAAVAAPSGAPESQAIATPRPVPATPAPEKPLQPEHVSFEVDPYNFEFMSASLTDDPAPFSNVLEDLFGSQPTTNGLGAVFHLDMTGDSLMADPAGEIEVSLGHIPLDGLDFDPANFFDFEAATTAPTATTAPADFANYLQNAVLETYNGDDFINYDLEVVSNVASTPAPAVEPLPSSVPQEPAVTALVQRQYIPPTGASLSANRRVAGSWKPPFSITDPQARTWGVPAS